MWTLQTMQSKALKLSYLGSTPTNMLYTQAFLLQKLTGYEKLTCTVPERNLHSGIKPTLLSSSLMNDQPSFHKKHADMPLHRSPTFRARALARVIKHVQMKVI